LSLSLAGSFVGSKPPIIESTSRKERTEAMRLKKARVTKYRSIRDTGWFEVESGKSILVGPNEAGKTVLLEALQ
jgi:ABC-type multidrug transport system ATPase subunit